MLWSRSCVVGPFLCLFLLVSSPAGPCDPAERSPKFITSLSGGFVRVPIQRGDEDGGESAGYADGNRNDVAYYMSREHAPGSTETRVNKDARLGKRDHRAPADPSKNVLETLT